MIATTLAESREINRALRDWKRGCTHRRIALVTRRVPVKLRLAAMMKELGLAPVEGETLAQFVERTAGR